MHLLVSNPHEESRFKLSGNLKQMDDGSTGTHSRILVLLLARSRLHAKRVDDATKPMLES